MALRARPRCVARCSLGEFFGNQRDGRPGGDAHGHRQPAGAAAHGRNKVPAAGGLRVLHEVLDELRPVVQGGRKAEGSLVLRQRHVVVDGLRNVDGSHAVAGGLGNEARAEGRVIAADGEQAVYAQLTQPADNQADLVEGRFDDRARFQALVIEQVGAICAGSSRRQSGCGPPV